MELQSGCPDGPPRGQALRRVVGYRVKAEVEKARAVAKQQPGSFVLGADTIVVVDGIVLGKPRDAADAARMLRLLSGRGHEVITGVCLIGPGWTDFYWRAEPSRAELSRAERSSAQLTARSF